MFNQILDMQQRQYGPQDRRCHVTIDKIKMVQSQGIQYAVAIKELERTFAMPEVSVPKNQPIDDDALKQSRQSMQGNAQQRRRKSQQQNKVLKVLSSIRKKKP